MTFTQIPQQYAPLGAEAVYAVENPAGGDLDIRIADEKGATLGALRFAAAATARFDAAPALRRRRSTSGSRTIGKPTASSPSTSSEAACSLEAVYDA